MNTALPTGSRQHIIMLTIVFLLSFFFRVWLLDQRWINPDEGAHLMDAVLALDGKVPLVDFSSRQPLYVYVNALILKLFGISYTAGRLLPLTCSLLIGLFVYLIAKTLFDGKVAFLSAVLYWLIPLELFNSVIVKTEPLTTLLACISFYLAIVGIKKNAWPQIAASGAFAALGFYVRQSVVIIPVVFLGLLFYYHKGAMGATLKRLYPFLVGYAIIVLTVLLVYMNYRDPLTVFFSSLNPVAFLLPALKKILIVFGKSAETSSPSAAGSALIGNAGRNLHAFQYIKSSIMLHLFLVMALIFSFLGVFRHSVFENRQKRNAGPLCAYLFLYSWIGMLFLAYAYYYFTRGYYIDYFREFLPPLIILFSAWLVGIDKAFERYSSLYTLVSMAILCALAVWAIQAAGLLYGKKFYALLTACCFAFFVHWKNTKTTKGRLLLSIGIGTVIVYLVAVYGTTTFTFLSGVVPSIVLLVVIFTVPLLAPKDEFGDRLKAYPKFLALSILAITFMISMYVSATQFDLKYESIWSPESLKKVSAYLEHNTNQDEKVLSGAVIWEFQALRRPYLSISHPLALILGISDRNKAKFQKAVHNTPPVVVIIDGYTQKTYFKQFPWLEEFINNRYQLVADQGPAKYPIKIYRLN